MPFFHCGHRGHSFFVFCGLKKTMTTKLIFVFFAIIAFIIGLYFHQRADAQFLALFDLFWIPGSVAYFIILSGFLFYFAGAPVDSVSVQRQSNEIGLTNSTGIAPELVERTSEYLEFRNQGLTPKQWEEFQINIEAILGIKIVKIEYLRGYSYVRIYYVNVGTVPSFIEWDDKYLSKKETEIALGIGPAGTVKVDIEVFPHHCNPSPEKCFVLPPLSLQHCLPALPWSPSGKP